MVSGNVAHMLLFALGIVLTILASIQMSAAGKTDQTSVSNAKNTATGVLVIGLIILLFSGYNLYSAYSAGQIKFYY